MARADTEERAEQRRRFYDAPGYETAVEFDSGDPDHPFCVVRRPIVWKLEGEA